MTTPYKILHDYFYYVDSLLQQRDYTDSTYLVRGCQLQYAICQELYKHAQQVKPK